MAVGAEISEVLGELRSGNCALKSFGEKEMRDQNVSVGWAAERIVGVSRSWVLQEIGGD